MNQDTGVFTGVVMTIVVISIVCYAWGFGREQIRDDCRNYGYFQVGTDRFTCKELTK